MAEKSAPLDIRLLMYEQALKLRRDSYTLRQIADPLSESTARLSEATISSWTRGINAPNRAGHVIHPETIAGLAYVIGVETGDGFLNVKRKTYQYRIRLRAVDREFVRSLQSGRFKSPWLSSSSTVEGNGKRDRS